MTLEFLINPLRALAEKFQDPVHTGFSLKILDSLPMERMKSYIRYWKLPFLGEGSSRTAYRYKNYALKIAWTEEGLGQNALEARVGSSDSPVVVNVVKVGRANKWILTELVEPIGDFGGEYEFRELAGVDFDRAYDYWTTVDDLLWQKEEGAILDPRQEKYIASPPGSPFVQEVMKLIIEFNLQAWDMRLENLGIVNRDGRSQLVVLDVGLSHQVMEQYYNHEDESPEADEGYAAKGVQENSSRPA